MSKEKRIIENGTVTIEQGSIVIERFEFGYANGYEAKVLAIKWAIAELEGWLKDIKEQP